MLPLRAGLASAALWALVACTTVTPPAVLPAEPPPALPEAPATPAPAPAPALPFAPVEGRVIAIGKGATRLTFSSDGRLAYVTDNEANALSEVELATGKILRVIRDAAPVKTNDGCPHNFCRGIGAVGIALSSDDRAAYVTSMRTDAVSRVDLASGRITWSTKVQRFPQPVAVSPDGQQVWLYNLVANSISTVNAKTGARIGKPIVLQGGSAAFLPFGRPVGFAMSPDGKRVYVSSALASALDVYDTRTRKRVGRTEPGSPWAIAVDRSAHEVWALYSDGLLSFDPVTLEARNAMRYCRDLKAYRFALSGDGRHVAVSLPEEDVVLVAARESGLLTHAFRTGHWPLDVTFTPDSRQLVALDSDEQGGLSIFDLGAPMNLDRYLDEAGELFCRPARDNP